MYFVLYDLNDNVIAYYDNLNEFADSFNYLVRELRRKFNNSKEDFVYCDIDNTRFKLFRFEECV